MTANIHNHRILILDFGSQYTQLIARRIREIGVYCELWAWDVTEEQIREFNPNGIILSGGPESTTEDNSPRAPEYVFNAGVPVLGICYGMQTMSMQLGGDVEVSGEREFGYSQVEIRETCELFRDIQDSVSEDGKPLLDVWMSHGDKVTAIPADFVTIASTETCPFAIMANEEKRFYGVQFHPMANTLSLAKNLIILCGHFKGIDYRIREHLITKEISIGDYVLTGGELAAAVMADAIVRIIPGVISDEQSALSDSFQDNLLAAPVYTRPADYKGWKVPEILLSGHEAKIKEWELQQSLERTRKLRPDLLGE